MKMDKDTLKEKIRSFSTLNSLHHETRQEVELLNKQIYVKDNIIADLKARLGRYERIYMTDSNSREAVVIGPSKSLLESLCKEICKLKQRRDEVEFKASRQVEVKKGKKTCWDVILMCYCMQMMFGDDGGSSSLLARTNKL